jgi:excisionase family DNA binding protein
MTNNSGDKPYFLCVKEFAGIIRVSTWQVYELIKRGEIPVVRFGRVMRISSTTIDAMHKADEQAMCISQIGGTK